MFDLTPFLLFAKVTILQSVRHKVDNRMTCNSITIVKLHFKLANPTELQLDGAGVDFFPPSQLTTTTNPHQILPEESVKETWNLALILNSKTKTRCQLQGMVTH